MVMMIIGRDRFSDNIKPRLERLAGRTDDHAPDRRVEQGRDRRGRRQLCLCMGVYSLLGCMGIDKYLQLFRRETRRQGRQVECQHRPLQCLNPGSMKIDQVI